MADLIAELAADLCTITGCCELPDGDGVAMPVVLWAERWLEKLRTHHADIAAAVRDAIPASELVKLLPGTYYMDPPDGGDVPLIEQFRRMARDAARYRYIKSAPAGIVRADFHSWAPSYHHWGNGKSLDKSLDAAMAQEGAG